MSSNDAVSVLLVAVALAATALPVGAAEDLGALRVQGQRGQSAEQMRRDRYECHNWAVEQSGEAPVAVPVDDAEPSDVRRERRARRIDRAIAGAAIGAGLGGLVRATQHEDASHGVLAGAAVGAAVGAVAAGPSRNEAAGATPESSGYLRALTACLEGRGYSAAMPTTVEVSARR
jgi:uncharacterized protein YcfJ